jgi:hypothetical protein
MVALKHPSFFGKAKRHAILDFLTYRPRRLGANVVSIPTERGPLLTQISTDLHPTCAATLGDLEPLPLELFNEIYVIPISKQPRLSARSTGEHEQS